jgi:Poxvirus A32 protein
MGKPPEGNKIHVYDGAAETVPCPYGEPFPDLPTSFLLAAPTASGKTMIILNLLLRYYKDMFARIWFFSPSIKLDPQYAPLRKHLEKMTDQSKEPLMFEDLDQKALGKLLDEQRLITEECRKRKMKPPQVCVVLDDLADRGDILMKRQGGDRGSHLVSLATRGRHFGVTWIISSQVLNLVGSVIRKNVRCMCVWRLRNHKEIETLCEELSGIYDAKTIMELYSHATSEAYSFMFVRLDAKTRRDMFWLRFEARLLPKEESDDEGSVGQHLGARPGEVQQVRPDRPGAGQPPGVPKRAPGKG